MLFSLLATVIDLALLRLNEMALVRGFAFPELGPYPGEGLKVSYAECY